MSCIRNVCVLAHVDHGKTTLTDSLVASNGIISERMAGHIRFLDHRQDEQLRGITMESHCISLVHANHLINLVDSPGHVDFSADVSSAVRLCDGALLVVDVVEGVCVQTHAVMRMAWEERLTLVLVLNKVDRLITELLLSPVEAHLHLHKIVEQVNAVMSGLIRDDQMKRESGWDDSHLESFLFAPDKGNVVFASGTDTWAFGLADFSRLISKLLQTEDTPAFAAGLWAIDKYWDGKQVSSRGKTPMFAQYVLANVFELYSVARSDPPKPKKLQNMLSALSVTPPHERELSKDPKSVVRSAMGAWLPCARALLEAVCRVVPDPRASQRARVELLWPRGGAQDHPCRRAIAEADAAGPLVIFCSKVVAVPLGDLPDAARALALAEHDDEREAFVCFGRVFAGTARPGCGVFVIGPKNEVEAVPAGLQPLLIMGSDLMPLDQVPCGNICALAGLGKHLLKTGTVSTDSSCPSLSPMPAQSAAVLRVSVEPLDPRDWDKLSHGLRLLNKADAVLEVRVQPSGEHVVCAIGDLHLERCLKDLRERFAKCEFKVSAPMASFKETIVRRPGGGGASRPIKVETVLGWQVGLHCLPLSELGSEPRSTLCVHSNNALVTLCDIPNKRLEESLVSAFIMALRAGALCEEPLWGVGFVVDDVQALELEPDEAKSEGQVVSQLAEGMKRCFKVYCEGDAALLYSGRLVEGMFKCSLHCLSDGDQLGKLFSVVSKRRGRVVSEGMIDGTSLFQIEALIPVVEAFGVADELRKKTSGAASSPQLVFSHWEVLDVDPLHKAVSEDELEDAGETVENDMAKNIARRFMLGVRRRKGLATGEKVVKEGEKQRTMSRKR